MREVITIIAFDRTGEGRPVILVGGAMRPIDEAGDRRSCPVNTNTRSKISSIGVTRAYSETDWIS